MTGAVGSAAARIARWRGARVIGTIRKAAERDAIPDLPVDQYVNLEDGPLPGVGHVGDGGPGCRRSFSMSSAGRCSSPACGAWPTEGRHVAIASTGDGRVGFNLVDFYHREGRIYGVDTLKLDFAASAAVLRGIMPGVEQGLFKPPDFETVTLDQAVRGLRANQRRHGPQKAGHRVPIVK